MEDKIWWTILSYPRTKEQRFLYPEETETVPWDKAGAAVSLLHCRPGSLLGLGVWIAIRDLNQALNFIMHDAYSFLLLIPVLFLFLCLFLSLGCLQLRCIMGGLHQGLSFYSQCREKIKIRNRNEQECLVDKANVAPLFSPCCGLNAVSYLKLLAGQSHRQATQDQEFVVKCWRWALAGLVTEAQ